jgi:hypothetical protein
LNKVGRRRSGLVLRQPGYRLKRTDLRDPPRGVNQPQKRDHRAGVIAIVVVIECLLMFAVASGLLDVMYLAGCRCQRVLALK